MDSLITRLIAAMNRHDPRAVAAQFAADYVSEQPAHPQRGFGGSDQVLTNWTSVFAGVPDFSADLVATATADASTWAEMRWSGTHLDGTRFQMSGVIVLGVRDDTIAWARLYMEPVEEGGGDIDSVVRERYRAPNQTPATGQADGAPGAVEGP